MENGTTLIKLVAGVIVTCGLLSLIFLAYTQFKNSNNITMKNNAELNEEFRTSGLDRFNGVTVQGSEVLSAVAKYKDGYQIRLKHGTNAYYLGEEDAASHTISDSSILYNKSSGAYVDTKNLYYASLFSEDNVIGITFTLKTGTPEKEDSEESLINVKKNTKDVLFSDFINQFSTQAEKDYVNTNYNSLLTVMEAMDTTKEWGLASSTENYNNKELNTYSDIIAYIVKKYGMMLKDNINNVSQPETSIPDIGTPGTPSEGGSGSGGSTQQGYTEEEYKAVLDAVASITGGYQFSIQNSSSIVLEGYTGTKQELSLEPMELEASIRGEQVNNSYTFASTKKGSVRSTITKLILDPATDLVDYTFAENSMLTTIDYTDETGTASDSLKIHAYSLKNCGNVKIQVKSTSKAWANVKKAFSELKGGTPSYGTAYSGLFGASSVTFENK